jgi:uncharacterized membrane protein
MTRNISTFRSIVTRCLAAGVLLCIYCIGIVGTSALVLAASSTTADARGGGGRGGGGRGGGGRGGGGFRGGGFRGGGFRGGGFRGGGFRGRGRGWGWGGYVEPGCYYSYRWGRVICPYY